MNNYYLNVFRKVLTMASHRAMMPSRQGVHKTKNATKDFFINNNSAKSFRKVLTMASHRAMMPSRQGVQKTKNATKDFLINNNSVKSFKKVFMLASCIAMMLAIFTPQTVAQDYLYAGPVDGSGNPIVNSAAPYYSAQNQNYYMFIGYDLAGSSSHAATLYILRNADMTNAEAGALLSASLWTSTPYNAGGGNDMNVQNMSLLLRNLPISDLPTQHLNTTVCPTSGITGINCYINAGWTLVKSDFTLSVLNNKTSFSWSDFIFDAPFEYDGVSNLGVLWIRNDASSVNSAGINYIGYNNTATSPFNNWYVKYGVGNWTSTNTSGSAIPISRFLIESEDHPNIQNYYKGAKVSLPGITTSQPAKKNVPVLNLSITTAGDMPPTQRLNQITFVEKNALTNLDAAKLYFSGTSSTFDLNTAQLLGTLDIRSGQHSSNTFTFDFSEVALHPRGTYYFWLVYDLSRSCDEGVAILDAYYSGMNMYTMSGGTSVPTLIDPMVEDPDPAGGIDVWGSMYIHTGPVTGSPVRPSGGSFTTFYPGRNYAQMGCNFSGYSPTDMQGIASGVISNYAIFSSLYLQSPAGSGYQWDWFDSVYIYMRNRPTAPTFSVGTMPLPSTGTPVTSYFYNVRHAALVNAGFTCVKSPCRIIDMFSPSMYNASNKYEADAEWLDIELDVPFEYTGGHLEVVVEKNSWAWGITNSNYYRTTAPYAYMYAYMQGSPGWDGGFYTTTYTTSGTLSTYSSSSNRLFARFNIDMSLNDLVDVWPPANSVYYSGVEVPLADQPKISFFKSKEVGTNGMFSYRIIRKSDNALVYQAVTMTGDTLIQTEGYDLMDDIVWGVSGATGSLANSNGTLNMSSIPQSGQYEVQVRWYTGGSRTSPSDMRIYEFTIEEPLAEYISVTPWYRDPVVKGVTLPPSQYPGIRYFMASPNMAIPIITYTITRVETNEVVYTALSEETGQPNILLNMFSVGSNLYNFRNASGVGAATGASSGQLNTFPLEKGWYHIDVSFDDRVSPMQYYRDSFLLTDEYDIGIISVDVPQTTTTTPYPTYPIGATVPIEYTIFNYGVHDVIAFNMVIRVRRQDGSLVDTVLDQFNNPTYPVPLASMRNFVSSRSLVLDSRYNTGNYYVEAELEMVNPSVAEAVYTNNYWPENASLRRYFSVLDPLQVNIGNWLAPVQGGYYRYPVYPTVQISNTGTADVSGILMQLEITGPGYSRTWSKLLENLPAGRINYPFQFDSIFFPTEPGQYAFNLTYTLSGTTPQLVPRNINISAGLGNASSVSTYTIGQPRSGTAGNFPTIKSAMQALYHRGVAGHIIFEIIPTDNVTKLMNAWDINVLSTGESVLGASRIDTFSLLDFRGRIMGLGPDATITFTVSPTDLTEMSPVTLLIRNNSGFGVAFGNTHANNVDSAAVNIVYEQDLRNYLSHSNGYITFDGGSRRNLIIRLENTFEEGTNTFAAPIFLDHGANNITIRNCRIEGSSTSMQFSTQVPNVNYVVNVDGTASFNFDALLETSIEPESVANPDLVIRRNVKTPLSAGILFYNKPIEPQFILNNWYHFDNSTTSDNNVIEGNIIRGFGYGIFSLGMGGRVNNQVTVDPMYNTGNQFLNNFIQNVSAAGIFLGFEKDAVISGNRINNVSGAGLENSDVAAIQLGLIVPEKPIAPDRPVPPYMFPDIDLSLNNTNILLEKNEITNVLSDKSSYGIVIYEPTNTLRFVGKDYYLLEAVSPPHLDNKYTITNNIIYKIISKLDAVSDRIGVAISPSKDAFDTESSKINKVLIANNTIIMDDVIYTNDNNIIDADGMGVSGIQLFDANNYEIVNNAIYVRINPNVAYDYVSAVSLRGLNPKLLKERNRSGLIDYNSYFIDRISTSQNLVTNPRTNDATAFVRFFEVDKYGRLLDGGGFAKEYATLRNWNIWTGADANSIDYNFYNATTNNVYTYYMNENPYQYIPDLYGTNTYTRLRFVDTMHKVMSLLDRGKLLNYVSTDIDNASRLATGKVFNIGAIEFYSKHLYSDIEVKSIVAPGGYLGNINGGDMNGNAEQVMIDRNQAVYVRAIVRNNGQTHLNNIPIYCNVTGTGAPAMQSINVSLAVGEQKEITFYTSAPHFRPRVGTTYATYTSMATAVSDVYTISVFNNPSNFLDDNRDNDRVTIRVRFFVPQSELGLLVSAKHSNAVLTGNNADRVNQDRVAGKLNFDTVVSALNSIGYYQTRPAGEGTHDFDVLNRNVWEPRNVNYSMYSAVIWSDGHDDTLTFWEKQSLIDYAESATPTLKRTLIVNSEEMLTNNGRDFDPFNMELQDNVITSRFPLGYNNPNIIIRGEQQNHNLEIVVGPTGYYGDHTSTPLPPNPPQYFELNDVGPMPYKFSLVDTAIGQSHIAYYFYTGTKPSMLDTSIATVSNKRSERNAIYTAIDWRHLKNASAFMNGIFNDVANDFWTVDTTILAMNLANFNANPLGKSVLLDWQTLTETGIANFEVQRANIDDNNIGIFNSVLSRQGAGYSKTLKDYNVIDYDVNYGSEYAYRLKINEFDGNHTYSPVKIVNIEYTDGIRFGEVIPNPTNESASMEYSTIKDATIRITISDLSGREVAELFNGFVAAGPHKVDIDATKLASGSYNINYFIDGKMSNKVTMFTVVK